MTSFLIFFVYTDYWDTLPRIFTHIDTFKVYVNPYNELLLTALCKTISIDHSRNPVLSCRLCCHISNSVFSPFNFNFMHYQKPKPPHTIWRGSCVPQSQHTSCLRLTTLLLYRYITVSIVILGQEMCCRVTS